MSVSYGGDKITFDDGTSIASGLSHFRNRVINGAMEIDQRRNGSAATVDGDNVYGVDRWTSTEIGNGAFTQQQISDAPSGFKNSLRITTTTAQTGTLNAVTRHYIEGTNLVDLAWGTASAKAVTLSFWVKSSLTGTFGGAIRNDSDAGALRNYVISYTISSANTWEYKTITIPGDTTGTWPTTTGIGLIIWFSHGTANLGAAGSWSGSDHRGVTGQTNLISTLNATWQITGVQFEVGSFATTFERRPYGTEFELCQRYFQVLMSGQFCDAYMAVVRSAGGTVISMPFTYQIPMRASPTIPGITVTNLRVNGRYGDTALTGGTVSFADITPRGSLLNVSSPTASGWTFNLGEALYVNTQTTATNLLTVSAEL
jgi:hypothetical protein